MLLHSFAGFALVLLAIAPPATAGVRVVSSAGGAPYTTIQGAVNAAVDGDVVLVRNVGAYAGFTVTNKALAIVGDSATSTVRVNGAVSVTNVGATRAVVLANLEIQGPTNGTSGPTTTALRVESVSGSVRLQRCTILGGDGTYGDDSFGYGYTTRGGFGMRIENCAGDVALELCTLRGGSGQFTDTFYHGVAYANGSPGSDALYVADARVATYDCALTGGAGGNSYDDVNAGDGAAGLRLVRVAPSASPRLMAANTSFSGGRGGDVNFGVGHDHLGNGGHGLWIGPGTLGWVLDSTFAGGAPGDWLGGAPFGVPGTPIRNDGSETSLPVTAIAMRAPFLLRAQTQSFQLRFFGSPGDQVFLFESDAPSYIERADWRGVRLARQPGPSLQTKPPTPIATIPASGEIAVPMPPLSLPPGELETTRYIQAYRIALDGTLTLGSFAAITVVDPSF